MFDIKNMEISATTGVLRDYTFGNLGVWFCCWFDLYMVYSTNVRFQLVVADEMAEMGKMLHDSCVAETGVAEGKWLIFKLNKLSS